MLSVLPHCFVILSYFVDPRKAAKYEATKQRSPHPEATRRSQRAANLQVLNNLTLVEVYNSKVNAVEQYYVPKTHAQALACTDAKLWIEAEDSEMSGLNTSGCFYVTKLPEGKIALPCKWVYTLKTDSQGKIQRYKARLCVRGDVAMNFEESWDWETFAPVARWESIRIFLALTVLLKLVPLQLDVDLAYLYADLDDEIYMLPPPGVTLAPGQVYRLRKSLYGLPQSGRNWNTLLDKVLTDWRFIRFDEDRCLYMKCEKGITVICFIYVDDLYVAGTNKVVLQAFVVHLQSNFKIKLLGVPQQLLGIHLTWGRNFETVHLEAAKLVNKLVTLYADPTFKPRDVPMDPNAKLDREDQLMDTETYKLTSADKKMQKQYQRIAGTVIFLVNTCRPDIPFASLVLCRSMKHPGWKHFAAAQHLLAYLKKYPDLGIMYSHTGNNRPYGYCDADNGSDISRKAVGGYMFFLAGGPISWKCTLTDAISLSTCEAEIRAINAAFEAIREACWLIKVLEEMGHAILGIAKFDEIELRTNESFAGKSPMVIFEDNQAAIAYSNNPTRHTLMKHMEKRLKWIQAEVAKKTIKLVYVQTENQLADVFTKALISTVFWALVGRYMLSLKEFQSFFS